MYATVKRKAGFVTPFMIKLLSILFIADFVKGALLVSILPIYLNQTLRMSAVLVGWAFALQYIGDNLMRGPFGWAVDRWGYKKVMTVGLIALFASVTIMLWLRIPLWILAASFLLGFGTSPLWPSAAAGSTEESGKEGAGRVLSWVYIASFVGTGTGPIVIHFFMRDSDMTLPLWIVWICAALSLPLALLLPNKTGRGGEMRQKDQPSFLSSFIAAFRQNEIGALFIPALFFFSFSQGVLTPVVTLFARDDMGLSANEFSLLLITGGAVMLLLVLLAGRWVDRLGSRPLLYTGIPVAAAATFAILFISSRAQLYAAVIAVGFGYALLIPAWNAMVASIVPEEKRGAAWGAYMTVSGSGYVAGPIVAGWLWESVGHRAPFIASAAALAGLFVLISFISFRKKGVIR